jgi:hypothetical protein
MQTQSPPPWLDRLNAMQKEWRLSELLQGRNPDAALDRYFRAREHWPPRSDGINCLHAPMH